MYQQITQEEAKRIMDSGAPHIVLDVREQDEFDEGHIPNAILIPYTEIDAKALSEKLGCPVVGTSSISAGDNGLKDVVNAAVAQAGKTQKAPYIQADIDLTDKAAVEAEDRKRFAFVNQVVKEVEWD